MILLTGMELQRSGLTTETLMKITDDTHKYPPGFFQWLKTNGHIWKNFEEKALNMAIVRSRYSARTIVEVMRWETDIKERTKTGKPSMFKLSNDMVPGLARLWMTLHGSAHPKFFQLHDK